MVGINQLTSNTQYFEHIEKECLQKKTLPEMYLISSILSMVFFFEPVMLKVGRGA